MEDDETTPLTGGVSVSQGILRANWKTPVLLDGPTLKSIFIQTARDIIRHAFLLTVTFTVLITYSILLHTWNVPPSTISDDITFPFRLTIPESVSNAVLWSDSIPKDSRTLILETHTHTTFSDGSMSPAQVVEWAIAYGFQVLFVTDHNGINGGLEAQKYAKAHRPNDILVIPGIEYTCCRIHMNLIGVNKTITPSSSWPTDEELQQVIEQVHSLGGLVIVNHLPWSLSTDYGRQVPTIQKHPSREQLLSWGVDTFESVSEGVMDLPTIRFNEANGLPLLTATDLHSIDVAPRAWTVLPYPGEKKPGVEDVSEDVILELLKSKNNTSFYYDPIGPRPRVYPRHNPDYDKYAPLMALDFSYFWSQSNGMYSFVDGFCHPLMFELYPWRMFWFVMYCLMGLGIYEAIVLMFRLLYATKNYQRWEHESIINVDNEATDA